ncbi:MAG: ribonuclease Z [Prevotellaceae bacterium]|jgi:ribonuclease Z|nr:ribonuclease Z [Prevotellaceae bacterium]
MEKFEVHILGCGSALPTTRHYATSQVVNVRDKLYMIDCGEGAQLQFRRSRLKFSRLNHVFISHLHGDHCFGLLGLVSTLSLLGRTAELHIHSPHGLQESMQPMLDFYCRQMSYRLCFHPFDARQGEEELIYEDRSVTVHTIPLHHRIPCCGFLFAEKPRPNHLIRSMTDFYQVPLYLLSRIKNGEDYVTPGGEVIPNARLTQPAAPPRRYAYCSDTAYLPELSTRLQGVDLLFHEATFALGDLPRARETFHSTAGQAAQVARDARAGKLLIGHFSARYENEQVLLEEAVALFPNTQLAAEGLCVEVLKTF